MLCELSKNNVCKMISFLYNSYRIYQVFQARDGHGKRQEGVKCTWSWRSRSSMVGLELGMKGVRHGWAGLNQQPVGPNAKWKSCNFILYVSGNHWDYSSRIGMGASQDSTKETECDEGRKHYNSSGDLLRIRNKAVGTYRKDIWGCESKRTW